MLFPSFLGKLLGSFDLVWRNCGLAIQNQVCPRVAGSRYYQGFSWLPRLSRILPQIHSRVRQHCNPIKSTSHQRRVLLDHRCYRRLCQLKERYDFSTRIAVARFHPIAFFNETLKGSALALSIYEKEMLAVVKAIHKWQPYPWASHSSSGLTKRVWNFCLNNASPPRHSSVGYFLGYNYVIQYKKGTDNQGADALSRMATYELSTISLPVGNFWSIL